MTDIYVKALEKRDESVLSKLESKYKRQMLCIANNLGISASDAEECINDTFLQVWNTIPPAKPKSISAYISMLMRRTVIDRIRYNSAQKRRNQVYLEVLSELEDCVDMEHDLVEKAYITETINSFLKDQSPQNREIFIRRYYEFESSKSIAKALHINSSTIDKRLSRMRIELKELFKEGGTIL